MRALLDIVAHGDVCTLGLLIVILTTLGRKMTEDSPRSRLWGSRLASACFVAYCGHSLLTAMPTGAAGLLRVAVRGLIAGGLTLGALWIVLPLAACVYASLVSSPLERARRAAEEVRRRLEGRAVRRQADEQRRRAREDDERAAPERERARQEAEARTRAEAEARKRREDARASCEILYSLHAPEIGGRFKKQEFDDFVARHLGNDRPPEYVEQRAQQLRDIIHEHLAKAAPPPEPNDIPSILAAYEQDVARIRAAGLPGEMEEAVLAEMYANLFERLRRKGEEA